MEFKFRAWGKIGNKMFEWGRIKHEFFFDCFDDEYLAYMQYTNLNDMFGVDIYEGDILWDEYYEIYGVVKFKDGKFIYSDDDSDTDLSEVASRFCVAGNIYENEDLLCNK